MTKKLKITRDEVIRFLEETYNIKDTKFMRTHGSERDSQVFEDFEYIEGEIQE